MVMSWWSRRWARMKTAAEAGMTTAGVVALAVSHTDRVALRGGSSLSRCRACVLHCVPFSGLPGDEGHVPGVLSRCA